MNSNNEDRYRHCRMHTCRDPSCFDAIESSEIYCAGHRCVVESCSRSRIDGNLCQDHKCREQGCRREANGGFCQKVHGCSVDGCGGRRISSPHSYYSSLCGAHAQIQATDDGYRQGVVRAQMNTLRSIQLQAAYVKEEEEAQARAELETQMWALGLGTRPQREEGDRRIPRAHARRRGLFGLL